MLAVFLSYMSTHCCSVNDCVHVSLAADVAAVGASSVGVVGIASPFSTLADEIEERATGASIVLCKVGSFLAHNWLCCFADLLVSKFSRTCCSVADIS